MDLTDIKKIMELMDEHGLSHFQFEKEDFNLKLKKGIDAEDVRSLMSSLPQAAAPAPVAAPAAVTTTTPSEAPAAEGEAIASPMVGTFYRRPNPESSNFVEVGDTISEGQTLCIIEAMKVMNEIKAEKSGTITEICVDDASPVQFGDPLFRMS